MLASAVYASVTGETLEGGSPPLPAYARMQHGAGGKSVVLPEKRFSKDSGLIEACALAAGTLLLVGLAGRIPSSKQALDRRKDSVAQTQALWRPAALQKMVLRALSLGLPFYATMQIGGMRVGLVLLTSIAANITSPDVSFRWLDMEWKQLIFSRLATTVVLAMSFITDAVGWTFQAPLLDLSLGYLALTCSVVLLHPPLPTASAASASVSRSSSKASTPTSGSAPWSKGMRESGPVSTLAASPGDANMTLVAGAVLSLVTIAASMWLDVTPSHYSIHALVIGALSVAAMAAAVLFTKPYTIRSQHKAGLGLGCLITASCAFLYSPSIWPGTVCNGGLCALSFLSVLYDTNASVEQKNHEIDVHEHAHNTYTHHHHSETPEGSHSVFTKFMLDRCQPGSLFYGILSEKDSRRIAYFTL